MKKLLLFGLVLLVAGIVSGGEVRAGEPPGGERAALTALGTAFTFQGHLKQAGSAVNGTCDFQFALYDSGFGGAQVGSTVGSSSVAVANGLFSTQLDFGGGAFDGQARWLETAVRCPAGAGDYAALSPRQALTPAPYALHAADAATANSASTASTAATASAAPWSGLTGIPPGFADGVDNDSGGTITGVTAGSGLSGSGTSGTVTLSVTGAPWSGLTGVPAGFADGVDDVGWSLSGNAGTSSANFLGTTDNTALVLKVGGAPALRLEPTAIGAPNIIGGVGSSVTSGVAGATIAGGGNVGSVTLNSNTVTDHFGAVGGGRGNRAGNNAGTTDDAMGATVGGGVQNTASGTQATVDGGAQNTASGGGSAVGGGFTNTASGLDSNVAGGTTNTASGAGSNVGGGGPNTASGFFSTVAGGGLNTASGRTSIVAGGEGNAAVGDWSFAAGRGAKANHQGAFVWGDSTAADIASTANNEFIVRADNGIWLGDATGTPSLTIGQFINTSTGAFLSKTGIWTNNSDRSMKAAFEPIDTEAVLAKVAALPIASWSFRAEDPSIRHMGPVAQDFYAAFGLGPDDRHIPTVDADGVALAAIQGLNQALEEKEARISRLEVQNAALEARLAALEARLAGGGGP